MKNPIRIAAIVLTVPCIVLSFLYVILLMLSSVIDLPFLIEDNVMFVDWFFLVIPILAFLSSILLQVSSVNKSSRKTHNT
jgi:hypothetical protein